MPLTQGGTLDDDAVGLAVVAEAVAVAAASLACALAFDGTLLAAATTALAFEGTAFAFALGAPARGEAASAVAGAVMASPLGVRSCPTMRLLISVQLISGASSVSLPT